MTENPVTPTTLYCANHPDRETFLRCNLCEKPICPECAILTPIGYRCRECVRGQQKRFDTAQWLDYPIAITIALVGGFLGSLAVSFVGFLVIFVGPLVGIIIAETVRFILRKRRSLSLFRTTTAAAFIGGSPLLLLQLLALVLSISGSSFSAYGLLSLLWQGLYPFLVASTVYYRLSGIQIGHR